MFSVSAEAKGRLRVQAFTLAAALNLLVLPTSPLYARGQKQTLTTDPRYASIVVDANGGAILRQANADSLRHPASLTKIMTLYLLFERLEAGKLKLSTHLAVSERAAAQAPTKLGLKPGQTIIVEDAIKALVTKSANDVAVVIAEALADSEEDFAVLMTRKARALGMARTVYRNASGLPDDEQVTTAHDQAHLGVLIQEQFPRYYRYFSVANFTYRGDSMRNHNRLLGRVAGVDGIKTGYTNASGFNLVTSLRRAGRHIGAVVLGGQTAGQRDAHMRELIEHYITMASLKRTDTQVASQVEPSERRPEPKAEAQPAAKAESKSEAKSAEPKAVQKADPRPAPQIVALSAPRIVIVPVVPQPSEAAANANVAASNAASNEPMSPNAVKTVPIRAAALPIPLPHLNSYAAAPELAAAPQSAPLAPALEAAAASAPEASPTPASSPVVTGTVAARSNRAQRISAGWAIQVGAFEQEDEARQRLSLARSKATALLRGADPHTDKATKGEKTFYRARFTGLDREQAEAACKVLQRNDVACMALKI